MIVAYWLVPYISIRIKVIKLKYKSFVKVKSCLLFFIIITIIKHADNMDSFDSLLPLVISDIRFW